MTMKLAKSPNIQAFTLILALFLACAHAANVTLDYVDASGEESVPHNVDCDHNEGVAGDENKGWDKELGMGEMVGEDNDLIQYKVTSTRKNGTITLEVDNDHVSYIKIWADNKKEREHALSWKIDDGQLGDPDNLGSNQAAPVSSDGKEGYFWVEGLKNSNDADDKVEIKAKLSDKDFDTHTLLVVEADLDVDSKNENELNVTGFSTDEVDKLEASILEADAGKVIFENVQDLDNDGIKDAVDGLGLAGSLGVSGLHLVPIKIKLSGAYDPQTAKITFNYNASVPNLAGDVQNISDPQDPPYYVVTKRGMRLWAVDGDQRISGEKINAGGDFIPQSEELNWADLSNSAEATLYVEFVDLPGPDRTAVKESISITVSVDSDMVSEDEVNVFLLPVEVVPDYNRDGMINDEDSGKVTEENLLVFWTNDDDDYNAEPHFGDIPGTQVDGADMLVNDARDLVDFFPVQLRIKEVLAVLPADKYAYKISHATGAFHYIEMPDVHPDSSPEAQGAGSYLRNPTMADEAMARPMQDTAGQGAELSAEYLNAAKDGMGVLLFEAKSATNQSFELIISKKDGGGEVGRISRAMPVEIVDVEKMFWRANIRPAAYGQTPGAVIEPANAKFKATRKERWFVFCHGYNVSEEAAKGWNAEVFKRLHQMGSDSKFLGVTWEGNQGQINPSIPFAGGATPDYWQNVYNAFQSSASLSTLVNGLSGGAKVIAGHSLGNMLVSSAICDKGLNAEKYFMLNAAVPREAYSTSHVTDRFLVRNPSWSQHDGDTRLWASDYWNLFANNDGRHKLTWTGRFSTLGANTAAHNYYSSGEEVLKKGNGSKPNLFLDVTIKSQFAWVKQEMSKGELTKKLVTGTHTSNGGWAYNSAWNGNPPADSTLLKATPYFKPFTDFYDANGQNPQSIHGANGSNLAAQYPLRGFLLGHDIPAISNPAGSDAVAAAAFGANANTDMPQNFRTGNWGDWKHSDIKNQPLGHVWKLYSDMVTRGSLNKDLTPPSTN